MDLGMSSMQVDTWERGFSYSYEAPLDMRMDPTQELTAAEIVNGWEERRIARLLRDYGEERYAGQIARAIVRARARAELSTTQELVDVIKGAIPVPAQFAGGHPAKRTFQALRIAVNDELAQIDEALAAGMGPAHGRRAPGGHLLPLARGPARKALPLREGSRMHLSAGPSDLRMRSRTRGRAAHAPGDRTHSG